MSLDLHPSKDEFSDTLKKSAQRFRCLFAQEASELCPTVLPNGPRQAHKCPEEMHPLQHCSGVHADTWQLFKCIIQDCFIISYFHSTVRRTTKELVESLLFFSSASRTFPVSFLFTSDPSLCLRIYFIQISLLQGKAVSALFCFTLGGYRRVICLEFCLHEKLSGVFRSM